MKYLEEKHIIYIAEQLEKSLEYIDKYKADTSAKKSWKIQNSTKLNSCIRLLDLELQELRGSTLHHDIEIDFTKSVSTAMVTHCPIHKNLYDAVLLLPNQNISEDFFIATNKKNGDRYKYMCCHDCLRDEHIQIKNGKIK